MADLALYRAKTLGRNRVAGTDHPSDAGIETAGEVTQETPPCERCTVAQQTGVGWARSFVPTRSDGVVSVGTKTAPTLH